MKFNPTKKKLGRYSLRLAPWGWHIACKSREAADKFWQQAWDSAHHRNFGHLWNPFSVLLLDGGDVTVKVSGTEPVTVVTRSGVADHYYFPVNFFEREQAQG